MRAGYARGWAAAAAFSAGPGSVPVAPDAGPTCGLPVIVWPGWRCPTSRVSRNAATTANATMPPTVSQRVSWDPAGAEHEREHRETPRDDPEAPVGRRQQHVLAVDRDIRVADLRVVLSLLDPRRDVETDRARLRRIAFGHRLTGAHRARELGRQPRRARRRRFARARAHDEHGHRDDHDHGERDPRDPPLPH